MAGEGAELGLPVLSCNGAETREPRTLPGSPGTPLGALRATTAACLWPGTQPPTSPEKPLPQISLRPPVPLEGREEEGPFSQPRPSPEARPARAGNQCPGESLKSIFSARHPSPAQLGGGRG
nr:coiled-coil domain-containing protein 86-like [Saimiri boliviensis boliviensis]